MNKRILGKDMEVSAVGLGCMGFSHAYGPATERKEAVNIIKQAYDMGYTFFDTAEVYGTQDKPHDNEYIVGEALAPVRNHVQIVSKFGIHFDMNDGRVNHGLVPDAKPETIRKSIDGSLKRLKTDHLDLYLQHRIDPKVEPETVAEMMSDLIKEGKILHWGISETNEDYLRRAHKVCPVTAVENRYSMMARQYETIFPVLEELGIGFIAFSPMANGILTMKYKKGEGFDKTLDYRSMMPQFTDEAFEENRELFTLLDTLSKEKNATPAQISMAWMMNKKPYIVPIPGSRKAERIRENMGAADIELTENEVKKLDRALNEMKMSAVFGGTKVI